MKDRRSRGVKIRDTASGLQEATSLFEKLGYSPEKELSKDRQYVANQVAEQLAKGMMCGNQGAMKVPLRPVVKQQPTMEPIRGDPMGTIPLPSIDGFGDIEAMFGGQPPSKKRRARLGKKTKKSTKGKKGKKGKKKKGGYKKRRSTTRRSKKRRSTTRRSKKPTLKRRTQRKKNKV